MTTPDPRSLQTQRSSYPKLLLALFAITLWLTLAACSGGAVEFAPTPLPPDLSPLRYEHPGGAFSISVPRQWSVYAQNTATLATAYFTPPGAAEPAVGVAVINLGESAPEVAAVINRYQTEIRPDADRYSEQDRQAMGDGSWRLTGLRRTVGGQPQQVNTFIIQQAAFLAVIDVIIPAGGENEFADLERIVNTLHINQQASLVSSGLETLSAAAHADLEVSSVTTWMTPQGVFFITGEVANHSAQPLVGLPVQAQIYASDGTGLVEAADIVMGYSIPPGGFAPFSLRFGQGQPQQASTYILTLGGTTWAPITDAQVYGSDALTWEDESSFTPEGYLLITGSVTNTSTAVVRAPVAIVTVFDEAQRVIAARFAPITEDVLQPGDALPYQIMISEIGGQPVNYIVNIQALP